MSTDRAAEASDDNCFFCRIIRGEVPSDTVLSTNGTYAFRDIEPAAPVHVLVVPKRHIRDAAAVGPDDGPVLAEMLGAAQQVAEKEGIAERGYRLVFNVGEDARNSVPHLHLHVLGGRRLGWPPG
ncbi:MAG: histidine triad nucleotide-binding protein [Actinomycetota bacterium]|nr:histidine triad nucleotide-binding protein [Actinomycetota bacterium]MDQ6949548.1 histidine triad nucleotide-binding protein [Actinomycetota bacterium]